jgi:hypothetical protein
MRYLTERCMNGFLIHVALVINPVFRQSSRGP